MFSVRTLQRPIVILLIVLFVLNTLLLVRFSGRSTSPEIQQVAIQRQESTKKITHERNGDIFANEDTSEGIRIAHLFLVHDHRTSVGVARILKRIWEPKHTYVIHIDRDNVTFMDTFIATILQGTNNTHYSNIYFISTQSVIWATIRMVQAELDLLSAAFQTGRWWDSAILWSGRCYPLKTNAFIEKKLTEWKGRNIGEAWGRGGFLDGGKNFRVRYTCLALDDRPLPECISQFEGKRGHPWPELEKWWHGSQWWLLSRQFAYYSLTSDFARNLLVWMANSVVQDEIFFQTLLMNSLLLFYDNLLVSLSSSWDKS